MRRHLLVNRRIRIPTDEFTWTFARSGGPGGQNVNKLNTKAVLRWPVAESPSLPDEVAERFLKRYANRITNEGELVLASQRYRDQARNIDDCLEKLRSMLASVAEPPKKRRPTKPSRAAKRRRLEEKKRRSERKQMRKPPRME